MIINSIIKSIGGEDDAIGMGLPNEMYRLRETFLTIRRRFDWLEGVFEDNEEVANIITANEILMYYIMEYQIGADDDTWGAVRDTGGSPSVAFEYMYSEKYQSIFDPESFLTPSLWFDALMNSLEPANMLTGSEIFMSVIMETT